VLLPLCLQTRLPYGWEYFGRPLDASALALPAAQPSMLAAVNALQTSPVVSLSQAAHLQADSHMSVAALAQLLGKFCAAVDLSPDDTPASCARCAAWPGGGLMHRLQHVGMPGPPATC
jgi:hypothetical protein